MKKVLIFGIAALAALSFSSCQKEVAVEENNNLVTVTLRAEKAGIDTRTEAVEEDKLVSFKWTEEDKANLKLFVVGKDDKGSDTFTEVDRVVNISSDYKTLTVTATVEESSTLRAVVSGLFTDKNKPKLNPNQSPKVDNFDPNADILVADDVTVDGLNEELLTFRRPITINKMTLKNMVAGEKVNEITISSDQDLVGYYTGEGMDGQTPKTITLSYDNVEVGDDGLFPVYFVAIPKEAHQLKVVVKTDQNTYTKSLGPVNFTVGKFSKFSTKLPAGTPVVDTDYTGDWVITGTNGDDVYAALAYASSGTNLRTNKVTLNLDDEEIVSTVVEDLKMHFEKVTEGDDYVGLYTIQDNSGNYLYAASSSKNQLKGDATLGGNDYYWSVEEETDGSFSIKAAKSTNSRNVMQFNYNNGNPIVSCYASASQKPVKLYKYSWVKEDDTPVVKYDFKKVTSVTSGKLYLMVGVKNNKYYAANLWTGTNAYGYMNASEVSPSNDVITVDNLTNALTIEKSGDTYTIKESDGNYVYAEGNYKTLNYGTNPTNPWTIEPQTDGTFKISAIGTYIQFGQGSFTSFGRYADAQDGAVMPYLYEYQGD